MAKVLSYENRAVSRVVVTALIVAVVLANIFVIFSPNENTRFYNGGLTSTVTIGVALVICVVQVYRYKRRVRSELRTQTLPDSKQSSNY